MTTKPRLLLVGDCQDGEAIAAGAPFGGYVADLLSEMLLKAGVAPLACQLLNVFPFKPPHGNIDGLFAKKAEAKADGFLDPAFTFGPRVLKPEHRQHLENLRAVVCNADCSTIVTLGPVAFWALTGIDRLSAYRGTVVPASLVSGRKVLPTYHPSDVVKQWDWRPIVVADLKKALTETAYPEIRRPHRSVWIAETVSDLAVFERQHLANAAMLAFDVETQAGQITCISLAPSPRVALVVPFWDKRKPDYSYWQLQDEIAVRKWLHKVLSGCSILRHLRKIGQNISYDLTYLAAEGIRVGGEINDTMLAFHSTEPELPKSLGFLASLLTSEPEWKTMRHGRKSDREKSDE